MILPIVRLDPAVDLPAYAHEGDAGLDLRSSESVSLAPLARRAVGTGIAVAIPDGHAGFVLPRSGSALKRGLALANSPGLIDSRYRGELKVVVVNLDPVEELVIERGDRIAQLVVQPVLRVELDVRETLDETVRGEGGLGSSGV